MEQLVHLQGIPGKGERQIQLTPALFELLLKFAKRKTGNGEDWLEIKPKGEQIPLRAYDIKDHNEIKRLLVALLDGVFGKGSWTKSLHEEPFRNTFFEMSEKRERKIRLSIPAKQITISE